MNINLHIERLVLDGLPIERHEGPLVKAAVEAELGRLLADGGLSADLLTSGAHANVAAQAIQLGAQTNATALGQQIARSLRGGITDE